MIRHDVYLPRYDWRVTIYYSVTCYYMYEILDALRAIGIDRHSIGKAYRNLASGQLDTGLTYSNPQRGESVMVISTASSPEEYANSIAHESQHLLKHICKTCDIDPYGEEVCYLAGELAAQIHHHASALYCNDCFKGLRSRLLTKGVKLRHNV